MKEFDLNRLKVAYVYIKRMADGLHPATNQPVDDEILNNPNVIRCLHFVSDVLEEVSLNHGVVGKKYSSPRVPFPLEILSQFVYRNDKPISHVLRQFVEPIEGQRVQMPSAAKVNKWLEANGYIEKRVMESTQKECWYVLPKGIDAGLYQQERGDEGREYITVMYSEKGQRFLVDNFARIIEETKSD